MDVNLAFLAAIVESSDDAIIGITPDGRIASWNDGAREIYGYAAGEVLGRPISILGLPERHDEIALLQQKLLRGERFKHFETLHLSKSGRMLNVSLSVSPILDRGGLLLGASLIARDISERLRSQELRHSLAVAREIQQHLLPLQAPAVPGLDVFARSLSCEEIGGDYYDFFLVPGTQGQRFGFTVGDVSGHGVGAALLMAMAKGVMHSEIQDCGLDLERILSGVNQRLLAIAQDSSFMTLFFGLFDHGNRTLHWHSAGHGPVFWYQSRLDRVNELLPAVVPLGIILEENFVPPAPIVLDPGDILLVGTDGLWEARNPKGEMFETRRLRQLLATWSAKSARQIHDSILAKVDDFRGGEPPTDDVTLMVVKLVDAPP